MYAAVPLTLVLALIHTHTLVLKSAPRPNPTLLPCQHSPYSRAPSQLPQQLPVLTHGSSRPGDTAWQIRIPAAASALFWHLSDPHTHAFCTTSPSQCVPCSHRCWIMTDVNLQMLLKHRPLLLHQHRSSISWSLRLRQTVPGLLALPLQRALVASLTRHRLPSPLPLPPLHRAQDPGRRTPLSISSPGWTPILKANGRLSPSPISLPLSSHSLKGWKGKRLPNRFPQRQRPKGQPRGLCSSALCQSHSLVCMPTWVSCSALHCWLFSFCEFCVLKYRI